MALLPTWRQAHFEALSRAGSAQHFGPWRLCGEGRLAKANTVIGSLTAEINSFLLTMHGVGWQRCTPLLPAQKAACWIIRIETAQRNDINFYPETQQDYFEKPPKLGHGLEEALVNTDSAWWLSLLPRMLLECISSGHSRRAHRCCTYHYS